jgi:Amt family ammonium transporter
MNIAKPLARAAAAIVFAWIALAAPAPAQGDPAAPATAADVRAIMESLKQSASREELMLRQGESANRKLDAIGSKGGGAEAPGADVLAAMEKRMAELEGKLAAAPAAAAPASGDTATALATLQKNVNGAWILLAGALVFMMQAGFCMLELGLARAKNSINICMKNFLDFCVGSIGFLLIGFAIMFGPTVGGWFGAGNAWLSTIPGNDPFWGFWFFQVVFAGTAATIVSGAMAERTKFVGYLIYVVFLSALIYPLVGHWAWGSLGGGFGYGGTKGWLEAMGFIDFAGSSVVHGVGGACALAGILVVGARHGRFDAKGRPLMIVGHNLPMATLGTFLLWFGWFGFNAGSTLVADGTIGRIAVNTTIAPAVGAVSAMLSMWLIQGRPDLSMVLNGSLGGAVGITACCAVVTPSSAVVIGLVAGLVATFGTLLLEKLGVDDAVGAVPVHLFNGWWGTLSAALFHEGGFTAERLGVQALGTFSMTAAAFAGAFAVFKVVDMLIGLRATDEEQLNGLDFAEHSANAYPEFVTSEQKLADFS